jgi:hypothetical protein
VYLSQPAATPLPGTASAFLAPGGDSRMVTIRPRPDERTAGPQQVLCSEPSPDWATAFATARSLSGSGGVSGGPSGSLSVSDGSSEAISQMAGRTAGVVALRDGLYSACQAYANGVIGKDAYALILSQYGNLLVALAGSAGSPSAAPAAAGGGAWPPGAAAVAQAQQQLVQAAFVACVSENDRTAHALLENPLLDAKCPALMDAIAANLPQLLKQPVPVAVGSPAAKPANAAPVKAGPPGKTPG